MPRPKYEEHCSCGSLISTTDREWTIQWRDIHHLHAKDYKPAGEQDGPQGTESNAIIGFIAEPPVDGVNSSLIHGTEEDWDD